MLNQKLFYFFWGRSIYVFVVDNTHPSCNWFCKRRTGTCWSCGLWLGLSRIFQAGSFSFWSCFKNQIPPCSWFCKQLMNGYMLIKWLDKGPTIVTHSQQSELKQRISNQKTNLSFFLYFFFEFFKKIETVKVLNLFFFYYHLILILIFNFVKF